jgi:hypothetical protein
MNYIIVLFKNKKRKKIINRFVTLDRAKDYFNKKINESKSVIFEKQVENALRCNYELALLSKKDNNFQSLFVRDSLGRQIKVDLDDEDYKIIDVLEYRVDEKIFDVFENKKISTNEFLKKYLGGASIKMLSKLNNKVVLQNDENVKLFTLKDSEESSRFLNSISDYLRENNRMDVIVVSESSKAQKKYLYDILENLGINKKVLYRTTTTFKERK